MKKSWMVFLLLLFSSLAVYAQSSAVLSKADAIEAARQEAIKKGRWDASVHGKKVVALAVPICSPTPVWMVSFYPIIDPATKELQEEYVIKTFVYPEASLFKQGGTRVDIKPQTRKAAYVVPEGVISKEEAIFLVLQNHMDADYVTAFYHGIDCKKDSGERWQAYWDDVKNVPAEMREKIAQDANYGNGWFVHVYYDDIYRANGEILYGTENTMRIVYYWVNSTGSEVKLVQNTPSFCWSR